MAGTVAKVFSNLSAESLRCQTYRDHQSLFEGHVVSCLRPSNTLTLVQKDRLISLIPGHKPLHAHALFTLGPAARHLLERCQGQAFEQAVSEAEALVDRYRHRIPSWTLCNEMLLAGGGALSRQWPHFVQRAYVHFSQRFPDVSWWLGEYGVRDRRNIDRVLAGIDQIRKLGGRVEGVMWVCYVDLDDWGYLRSNLTFLDAWPSPLHNLRYAFEQSHKAGLRTAMETSVFVGRPSPRQIQAQAKVYQALLELCREASADYWQWWPFDAVGQCEWFSEERNAVESPGWWDRDWNRKFELR